MTKPTLPSLELNIIGAQEDIAIRSTDFDDDRNLSRTGKKPILKRNFGFMSILGFSCLVLSTWIGAFAETESIGSGGPAGYIYSFIVAWAGNLATFTSLAELASMAPTAGGQYHWVSILAPRSYQKVFSYITGWLTVAGWQANVASSAYFSGALFQGLIEVVKPSYTPHPWHTTLLLYGALALAIFTTTVLGSALPQIEGFFLITYMLGFFGVLVPLVYLAPHGSAHDVFTTFINGGGWSSQELSFFVGISINAFAFLGADAIYHMSEEIHNAAAIVPRSIIWSLFINGVVGLSMYIAVLFCLGDIDAVLNSDYVYPFIEVLLQATHSSAGTAVILAIIIIVDLGLVVGVVAASSRMLWSFARDRGVPGWRQISRVDNKTKIPIFAIIATSAVSLLIGVISFASAVAFNEVISLTVSALYASYFVACGLLLWRRCGGSIKSASELTWSRGSLVNRNLPGSAGDLTWGPWRVPEPLGTAVNVFACAYLLVVFFFSFWPPATPVGPSTMNYSCLVMGSVAILSGLYYLFRARETYKGPIVDVENT